MAILLLVNQNYNVKITITKIQKTKSKTFGYDMYKIYVIHAFLHKF